jgi:phosphoserine phosphatase
MIDMHDCKYEKITINNLAVFDLDGTLYKCNSHIELLNQRYKVKVFDSIIMKAIGKIWKKGYLKLLYKCYEKVPLEYIENFTPEFRKSALEIMEEKKREGYFIVIVSNAPNELIEAASKRLNVDWLQARIGYKKEVVIQNYNFENLFVCTDNLTDINLLDIASERMIYVTKKTKHVFSERYPDAKLMEV